MHQNYHMQIARQGGTIQGESNEGMKVASDDPVGDQQQSSILEEAFEEEPDELLDNPEKLAELEKKLDERIAK